MSEIMLILAEEWVIGVSVCISICIVCYLVFSVLLVRSCRKNGLDVGVSGMIPFWNLVVLVKNILYRRRMVRLNKAISGNGEEFEL